MARNLRHAPAKWTADSRVKANYECKMAASKKRKVIVDYSQLNSFFSCCYLIMKNYNILTFRHKFFICSTSKLFLLLLISPQIFLNLPSILSLWKADSMNIKALNIPTIVSVSMPFEFALKSCQLSNARKEQ